VDRVVLKELKELQGDRDQQVIKVLKDQEDRAVLKVLNGDEFQFAVNQLPGYTAAHCGQVCTIHEAFPDLAAAKKF
jgi:hypothetical protein